MKNLIFIVSVFLVTNTFFSEPLYGQSMAKEIEINNSDKQTLVLSEKGLNVYFNKVGKINSPVYLEVMIENTNTEDVEISWEVKNKKGVVMISESSPIKAKSKYINHTSNGVIELKSGVSMSDFTFEINK